MPSLSHQPFESTSEFRYRVDVYNGSIVESNKLELQKDFLSYEEAEKFVEQRNKEVKYSATKPYLISLEHFSLLSVND